MEKQTKDEELLETAVEEQKDNELEDTEKEKGKKLDKAKDKMASLVSGIGGKFKKKKKDASDDTSTSLEEGADGGDGGALEYSDYLNDSDVSTEDDKFDDEDFKLDSFSNDYSDIKLDDQYNEDEQEDDPLNYVDEPVNKSNKVKDKFSGALKQTIGAVAGVKDSVVGKVKSKKEKLSANVDYSSQDKLKTSGVPFYKSIALRLLISVLIPIIGIIVLGLVSYRKASNALVSEYTNSVSQTTDMLQRYISLVLSSEIDEYKNYFIDKELKDYFGGNLDDYEEKKSRNNLNNKLINGVELDSQVISAYFLADEDKTLKTDSKLALQADMYKAFCETEEGKLVEATPNKWFVFGNDPEVDKALGISATNYCFRIARKYQNYPVVLIVDVDADFARGVMQSLDPGKGGYVMLVTSDGKEFYSDESVDVSNQLVFGSSFYDEAIEAEEQTGNKMVKLKGENTLFVYGKLSAGDAIISVVIPEKTLLTQANSIKRLSIILMIISTIIALILGLGISRQITSTINYILHQLRKVAGGNFTVRMETKSQDEFGLLCEGINRTVEQMKGLIIEVNDVSGELNDAASHVAETAVTFMETSEDIQTAVSEIEVGVNKLDTESADCLKQMDSLSDKISNVSDNTQTIEQLTTQTGKTITAGIESVQGLMDRTLSTTTITRNVITAIEDLEKKSHSISDIVGTINDISEQTKLLSLNASIEAARAGAAGRGFAVVAEEIRKLSDQCMNAAGQITEIVEEIVNQTGDVCTIAREAEAAVYSQTDVVENTTTSFRQIENQVESLIKALQTIVINVQNMDGSRSETLSSVENISTVSAQTAANSSTVYTKAETQLTATKELDYASQQLQAKADHLMDVLNQFQL